MAITVMSAVAEDLAQALVGAVKTSGCEWKADQGMLTSTDPALASEAWFSADLYEHAVVFTLLARPDRPLPAAVYAAYHGRMVEMLLTRFGFMIERITVKAPPAELPTMAPRKRGIVIADELKCVQ